MVVLVVLRRRGRRPNRSTDGRVVIITFFVWVMSYPFILEATIWLLQGYLAKKTRTQENHTLLFNQCNPVS